MGTFRAGGPVTPTRHIRRLVIALAAAMLVLYPSQVIALTIVNVIPQNLSSESDQNSEPSIAVNPSNTGQAIISAFSIVSQAGGAPSVPPNPYFSTQNGGSTWLNFQNIRHGDTTVEWSPGGTAYLTRLFPFPGPNSIDVQRSFPPNNPPAFAPIPGSTFTVNRSFPDQPFLEVARVGGTDRLYVGVNDLSVFPGKTATVRFSTDGGTTWNNEVIERVNPGAGQDGPPIRVAANGNRVYAAFERWTAGLANGDFTSNIVVVRDDNGVTGGPGMRFQALGANGSTVVSGLTVPFGGTSLGAERLGSGLSIAVDPNNPNKVFVAYNQVVGGQPVVSVHLSTDGGVSWGTGPVFQALNNAGLPQLSVAANGVVGLLYAHLNANGQLETRLVQSANAFASSTDILLFRFPNNVPPVPQTCGGPCDPYVGDYFDLEAVGNTFFGTFSASNDLNTAFSPFGVTFQRLTAGDPAAGTFVLLDGAGNNVPFSIDPYFFSLAAGAVPELSTFRLLALGGGLVFLLRRRRRVRGSGRGATGNGNLGRSW